MSVCSVVLLGTWPVDQLPAVNQSADCAPVQLAICARADDIAASNTAATAVEPNKYVRMSRPHLAAPADHTSLPESMCRPNQCMRRSATTVACDRKTQFFGLMLRRCYAMGRRQDASITCASSAPRLKSSAVSLTPPIAHTHTRRGCDLAIMRRVAQQHLRRMLRRFYQQRHHR